MPNSSSPKNRIRASTNFLRPGEVEEMSQRRLDVFFDFGSPFAYLLSKLLPAVAERASLEPFWRPIDLLGLDSFKGGFPYSVKKRQYVFVDVVRSAEFHKVDIQIPNPFPVRGARANRLAGAFASEPNSVELRTALFEAAWSASRDIDDDEVLSSCLGDAGADPAEWLVSAASASADRAVVENLVAAEALGVFGVPTMVLGDELFWGVDALPVLEWRASQS